MKHGTGSCSAVYLSDAEVISIADGFTCIRTLQPETTLRKRFRVDSVISIKTYYMTVLREISVK